MKVEDFFKEFIAIENYLFYLAGNFDQRKGFLNLLKYLRSENLLPIDSIADLDSVWQTRNKIVNAPDSEWEIPSEISDKLARIKSKIGL